MTRQDNNLWRDLLNNLREQRRHIHALIRLSREQTRVLAEADVERLAEITREQAEHLDELDTIEHERKQIVRRLGESAGLRAQPPTLTDCVRLAPEPFALTLKWLQQRLLEDTSHLQSLNERNRVLVDHAAETVNYWLAVVVNAANNQASYVPATAGMSVVLDTEV